MKKVIISALILAPAFVSAQGLTNLQNLVRGIGDIVTMAIPIVFGIIVLAFFWGLAKFIFAQGNEEAKAAGKQIMIWGLIALFVAASVWGLVVFIRTSLGVGPESSITVPTLNR